MSLHAAEYGRSLATLPEMPEAPEISAGSASAQSRTLLVTFLGAVVRRMGDWMPVGAAVELMTAAGLDAPSVRTAVSRLKKRGWLVPETRDGIRGYVLSDEATAALAQGDAIIWHARQPARLQDGWCIVNFSIPESERRRRQQLRAHLSALGFGNIGTALWIAPARMREAADRALAELGLTDAAAVFVGEHVAGRDLRTLIYESWDLETINDRYRRFIDEHTPLLESSRNGALDPRAAFVTYLTLVDDWRKLPYRDPGLPRELLDESWNAPAATELFERLVALLEVRALTHAAACWNGTDG
jgi:phenylacetic acid degradation operon negative regulatory protein